MNLKSKYQDFERSAQKSFKFYSDRIKFGSKEPEDFLNMSYYAGLLNGYKLAWYPLDNNVSEEEFNAMRDEVLQRTTIN